VSHLISQEEEKKAAADGLRSRMVTALKHSLRGPILAVLAERPASAGEIAAELEVPAESVGHQLRWLRREGLVQLVEKRERRGVAENYYRATLDPIMDDEEFGALSPEQRHRFSAHVIKCLSVDASRAHRAGTLDSRNDMCSAHVRMLLDERGWRELAEIHREAFEKVIALRRCVAERIKGSASTSIPAASTLLCFELPTLAIDPPND
jgi:DNA-binding transcriptional ArsR family regulator